MAEMWVEKKAEKLAGKKAVGKASSKVDQTVVHLGETRAEM